MYTFPFLLPAKTIVVSQTPAPAEICTKRMGIGYSTIIGYIGIDFILIRLKKRTIRN